jgi:hypothetical protein
MSKWRFPEMEHPFDAGIFHDKNIHKFGHPHNGKTPNSSPSQQGATGRSAAERFSDFGSLRGTWEQKYPTGPRLCRHGGGQRTRSTQGWETESQLLENGTHEA